MTAAIEVQTIERLAAPPDNQVQQIELLDKLLLYDKQLSVNRNEACAFCHMPEAGFTGSVSELNRTTGCYPGSVRTRFSNRTPMRRSRPCCTRPASVPRRSSHWEIAFNSQPISCPAKTSNIVAWMVRS